MWLFKCIPVFIIVVFFIVKTHTQKLAEQKIESYASCQTDRDCKENAFCFDNDDTVRGRCKCLADFELIRNTTFYECLKGVKLGDACEKPIQCRIIAGTLAVCNPYKICECNDESHNFEGFCHMKTKLSDICKTDYNCYLNDGTPNGTHGFCVDGRCRCPNEKKPSEDLMSCLTSRKLGENCIADQECVSATPHTRCAEICRCAADYTLSRNETTCVEAATRFGEKCSFDGQCSEYLAQSICINNKTCGCDAGYHGYGNRCVETRKTGEPCTENAQCLYDKKLYNNVKCDNIESGACKCLFGTLADGSCKIDKINDDSAGTRWSYTVYSIVLFLFNLL